MLISRLTPRYVLLSLCILALSPQATLAQTHAAKDTLWAKAVAIAEANESWMPSQWQETEIVFNKKGKVEETTARQLHLGLTPDYDLDVQLIKATKNGKDNLEEARRELEANRDMNTRESPEENPFDPAIQHTITVTRSSEVKRIDDRAYVAFTYVQKTQEGDWTGTAWLDAETGMPVQVETKPKGLPMKEDGVEVQALTSTTHYNVSAPDAWYPLDVQIDIVFKIKFVVFSFKGTSKTTITLSGYEKLSSFQR